MSKIATSLSNVFPVLDRSSATALHRQLYNQLREAILSGRLSAGTRLPSTRELVARRARNDFPGATQFYIKILTQIQQRSMQKGRGM